MSRMLALPLFALVVPLSGCTALEGALGLTPPVTAQQVEQLERDVQAKYDIANPTVKAMAVECRTWDDASFLCSIQDNQTLSISSQVVVELKDGKVVIKEAAAEEALAAVRPVLNPADKQQAALLEQELQLKVLEREVALAREKGDLEYQRKLNEEVAKLMEKNVKKTAKDVADGKEAITSLDTLFSSLEENADE